MDKIEDFQKRDVKEVVKTAAGSAIDKLKKYYKKTDALVYTISTSMFNFFFYNFILIIIYSILLLFNIILILFFSS